MRFLTKYGCMYTSICGHIHNNFLLSPHFTQSSYFLFVNSNLSNFPVIVGTALAMSWAWNYRIIVHETIESDLKKKRYTAVIHYMLFLQFWSHFCGTMHCLPQRLKSTFFENFSNGAAPKEPEEWEKISKTLILVFNVIVQTLKTHFLTFSSETKIMKITHSEKEEVIIS